MQVLYPAFAMMALTMFCILRLGFMRYRAVSRGEIDARFFRLYRGYDEPEKLTIYSRHVVNQFETPLLFYVISISAYITGQAGPWLIGLAWAYVMLRYVHSYIHLTSNVVIVRFRLFAASVLVLIALWAVVLTGLMRQ